MEKKEKKEKKGKGVIWYLLFGIGYIAVSILYFLPIEWGSKRNVARTGRHYRNIHLWGPIYAVGIYALIIWSFLIG